MPGKAAQSDDQAVEKITATTKKSKRGGRRPGSGRKLGSGDGLTAKVQVCVTPEQKKTFDMIGGPRWLRGVLEREHGDEPLPEEGARPPQTGEQVPYGALFPCLNRPKSAAAGSREIDLHRTLVPSPETTLVVRVRNNDLVDEGILAADLLVVDRGVQPDNGSIVVLRFGECHLVRRLVVNGRRSEFHASAPGIEPLVPEEGDDWKVLGVVIGVVRTMR